MDTMSLDIAVVAEEFGRASYRASRLIKENGGES